MLTKEERRRVAKAAVLLRFGAPAMKDPRKFSIIRDFLIEFRSWLDRADLGDSGLVDTFFERYGAPAGGWLTYAKGVRPQE